MPRLVGRTDRRPSVSGSLLPPGRPESERTRPRAGRTIGPPAEGRGEGRASRRTPLGRDALTRLGMSHRAARPADRVSNAGRVRRWASSGRATNPAALGKNPPPHVPPMLTAAISAMIGLHSRIVACRAASHVPHLSMSRRRVLTAIFDFMLLAAVCSTRVNAGSSRRRPRAPAPTFQDRRCRSRGHPFAP